MFSVFGVPTGTQPSSREPDQIAHPIAKQAQQ
jgi:hypothetical protein